MPELIKPNWPLRIQRDILLIGTIFAWSAVVTDFWRFYDVEGTLFRIKDCSVPNPVTTPCFWGAWAFLIAFLWTIAILRSAEASRKKKQLQLLFLLIGGTIFAWSVNTYGLIKFFSRPAGSDAIGCSGQLVTNPFITPCFIGACIFASALISGIWTYRRLTLSVSGTPEKT